MDKIKFKDIFMVIISILLAGLMGWATWLTNESYANKIDHASMLTKSDGERIKTEAIEAPADKLDRLIEDVRALDNKLDVQSERTAAIMADLEHLKKLLE